MYSCNMPKGYSVGREADNEMYNSSASRMKANYKINGDVFLSGIVDPARGICQSYNELAMYL